MTTDSNHTLPVAPNLLGQKFNANWPNQIWVSDITYVPTGEDWHCYDNAPMESFWGLLKNELVHHRHFKTSAEVIQTITEYIEIFYRRQRKQARLGYLSPIAFAGDIWLFHPLCGEDFRGGTKKIP